MFRNFLISALRNFNRSKGFTIINVGGLCIGLAAVLIIFLYIRHETGYDTGHAKGDRIYRQVVIGKEHNFPIQPGVFLKYQRNQLKGVEAVTMLTKRNITVKAGEQVMGNQDFIAADSLLFRLFDWKVISGNPEAVLCKSNSVILTRSAAQKYFGDIDPVGKTILIDNSYNAVVGALIEDIPEKSFIHFLGILPLHYIAMTNESALTEWGNSSFIFFCLVDPGASVGQIEKDLPLIFKENIKRDAEYEPNPVYLQPLRDIHLYSGANRWEPEPQGNINTVKILGATAVMILLLAAINFVNLSTARNASRFREIGLRKVVGSFRSQIIFQFLVETALYIFTAFILALAVTQLILPWFNSMTGITLSVEELLHPSVFFYLLLFLLLMIGLAGGYPAFVLSAPAPAVVIRKQGESFTKNSRWNLGLREALVVVQFVVSVGLITGAIIVQKQLLYLSQRPLGFEPAQKLVIRNPWDEKMNDRYDAMVAALKQMPEVRSVSGTHNIPGRFENNYAQLSLKGTDRKTKSVQAALVSVSNNFFPAMDAGISQGEGFPVEMSKQELDSFPGCIINEALASKLVQFSDTNLVGMSLDGFYDPLNQRKIIGIVSDIHFRSLRDKVVPAAFIVSKAIYPNFNLNLIVDINSPDMPEVVEKIRSSWEGITSDWPFESFFLDQSFDAQYRADQNLSVIIRVFTVVALIISLTGLLALVMYVTRSKRRELGIRKTLGASEEMLLRMMSWKFVRLVLFADLMVLPFILWFASGWLEDFAYHTNIGWILPMLVVVVSVVITMVTIIWQTRKAVSANPVEVLKAD